VVVAITKCFGHDQDLRTGTLSAECGWQTGCLGDARIAWQMRRHLDFGPWEQILGAAVPAGTRVLMADGGNGCWSRSLENDEKRIALHSSLWYYDIVDKQQASLQRS
jgi:hypothetical protein